MFGHCFWPQKANFWQYFNTLCYPYLLLYFGVPLSPNKCRQGFTRALYLTNIMYPDRPSLIYIITFPTVLTCSFFASIFPMHTLVLWLHIQRLISSHLITADLKGTIKCSLSSYFDIQPNLEICTPKEEKKPHAVEFILNTPIPSHIHNFCF